MAYRIRWCEHTRVDTVHGSYEDGEDRICGREARDLQNADGSSPWLQSSPRHWPLQKSKGNDTIFGSTEWELWQRTDLVWSCESFLSLQFSCFRGTSVYGLFHFQTIKYVNILLDQHPELASYLVSIIPKPEDINRPNRPINRNEDHFKPKTAVYRCARANENFVSGHCVESCYCEVFFKWFLTLSSGGGQVMKKRPPANLLGLPEFKVTKMRWEVQFDIRTSHSGFLGTRLKVGATFCSHIVAFTCFSVYSLTKGSMTWIWDKTIGIKRRHFLALFTPKRFCKWIEARVLCYASAFELQSL